jgi:hypothetical protein
VFDYELIGVGRINAICEMRQGAEFDAVGIGHHERCSSRRWAAVP